MSFALSSAAFAWSAWVRVLSASDFAVASATVAWACAVLASFTACSACLALSCASWILAGSFASPAMRVASSSRLFAWSAFCWACWAAADAWSAFVWALPSASCFAAVVWSSLVLSVESTFRCVSFTACSACSLALAASSRMDWLSFMAFLMVSAFFALWSALSFAAVRLSWALSRLVWAWLTPVWAAATFGSLLMVVSTCCCACCTFCWACCTPVWACWTCCWACWVPAAAWSRLVFASVTACWAAATWSCWGCVVGWAAACSTACWACSTACWACSTGVVAVSSAIAGAAMVPATATDATAVAKAFLFISTLQCHAPYRGRGSSGNIPATFPTTIPRAPNPISAPSACRGRGGIWRAYPPVYPRMRRCRRVGVYRFMP